MGKGKAARILTETPEAVGLAYNRSLPKTNACRACSVILAIQTAGSPLRPPESSRSGTCHSFTLRCRHHHPASEEL